MRRFIGILIVFVGGVLGLTAMLGFAIDETSLLNAIQAPTFEPALNALLQDYHTFFTLCSFALIFLVLICSVIALAKGSTHMGFTIMVIALFAGFTAWPHGTPFMLIVIFGAHWIAIAETHAHAAAAKMPAQNPVSNPPAQVVNTNPPPQGQASDTVASAESTPPSSSQTAENDSGPNRRRSGLLKRISRRFFH